MRSYTTFILSSTLGILFLCTLVPLALSPSIARAAEDCAQGAGGFVPLACFNDSAQLSNLYADNDPNSSLGTYINKIFFFCVSIGALLAVLRLTWAGYLYMSTDAFGKKEHAKEVIRDTVLGLLLLLSVYLILHQINPNILSLEVNISALPPPAAAPTPTPTPASMGQYDGYWTLHNSVLGNNGHFSSQQECKGWIAFSDLLNSCEFIPYSADILAVIKPQPPQGTSVVPPEQLPMEANCTKNDFGFTRCTYAQFGTAVQLKGSVCGKFTGKNQVICGFKDVPQCENTLIDVGFNLDLCQVFD